MGKLKDQLAGIAALVAAIVAIGGGFVKYGEITTKLETIEGSKSVNIEPLNQSVNKNGTDIKVLQTEIELLKVRMEELKAKSSNPLGG
tara:strand:+ start:803 stop:1066 length:264 start_codon:yes stop_codon:yes gene_type:complete